MRKIIVFVAEFWVGCLVIFWSWWYLTCTKWPNKPTQTIHNIVVWIIIYYKEFNLI